MTAARTGLSLPDGDMRVYLLRNFGVVGAFAKHPETFAPTDPVEDLFLRRAQKSDGLDIARKALDAREATMEASWMAWGYRGVSNEHLEAWVQFLRSEEGRTYGALVNEAQRASLDAAFDKIWDHRPDPGDVSPE